MCVCVCVCVCWEKEMVTRKQPNAENTSEDSQLGQSTLVARLDDDDDDDDGPIAAALWVIPAFCPTDPDGLATMAAEHV